MTTLLAARAGRAGLIDGLGARPVYHAGEPAVAVYGPVGAAMERLLARYCDDELALILDFFTRANAELHAHIARLRSEPRPPRVE